MKGLKPMNREFDFENDVAIDLDNLHTEWKNHAQIRYDYAKEISYLDKVAKKSHEKVKVIRSKLIKEAKENGAGNAQLQEAYYRVHEDHIKAKEEQIDAEYELSMAWNAMNGFDDRKIALENEVKLWTRNYFSSPTEERTINAQSKETDSTTESVRGKMNLKRRRHGSD